MSMDSISELPREKLLELIAIYAKNWLAHDGLWFQSIESGRGMDEAMLHDRNAWERFTVIEARRIKKFLGLPEQPGLEGLRQALAFRLYAPLNRDECVQEGDVLTYQVASCRVQSARRRKNMPFHPCKSVGIVEYSGFAKTIDSRVTTECVSCFPDLSLPEYACVWRFVLRRDSNDD